MLQVLFWLTVGAKLIIHETKRYISLKFCCYRGLVVDGKYSLQTRGLIVLLISKTAGPAPNTQNVPEQLTDPDIVDGIHKRSVSVNIFLSQLVDHISWIKLDNYPLAIKLPGMSVYYRSPPLVSRGGTEDLHCLFLQSPRYPYLGLTIAPFYWNIKLHVGMDTSRGILCVAQEKSRPMQPTYMYTLTFDLQCTKKKHGAYPL